MDSQNSITVCKNVMWAGPKPQFMPHNKKHYKPVETVNNRRRISDSFYTFILTPTTTQQHTHHFNPYQQHRANNILPATKHQLTLWFTYTLSFYISVQINKLLFNLPLIRYEIATELYSPLDECTWCEQTLRLHRLTEATAVGIWVCKKVTKMITILCDIHSNYSDSILYQWKFYWVLRAGK